MVIDWINFHPWKSLAGGTLIGLVAGVFVVLNGRVARINGWIYPLRLEPATLGVFSTQAI